MKKSFKIATGITIAVLLIGGSVFAYQVFTFVKQIKAQNASFTEFHGANAAPSSEVTPTNAELVPPDAPSIGPPAMQGQALRAGNKNSPLTVVLFCDFECPFCRAEFPIIREFISSTSDRVRFVFRNFPNEDIHPHAMAAAEAAACANDQGKFWQMHDKLFQNAEHLDDQSLLLYGNQIGLTEEKFRQCVESKSHEAEIRKDLSDAVALGVRGTPTFFINGHKLEGVIPSDVLQRIVEIGLK